MRHSDAIQTALRQSGLATHWRRITVAPEIAQILDHYQGNADWAAFAIFSLLMMFFVGRRYWREHRAGHKVEPREVFVVMLFLLYFVGSAVYEIMTHQ